MDTLELRLPSHWACPFSYGDTTGLDDDEQETFYAFTNDMLDTYGACLCVNVRDDASFMTYHDARPFGVLACEASTFVFDVTNRKG